MNKLSLLTDGDAFQVCRQGLSLRLSLENGLVDRQVAFRFEEGGGARLASAVVSSDRRDFCPARSHFGYGRSRCTLSQIPVAANNLVTALIKHFLIGLIGRVSLTSFSNPSVFFQIWHSETLSIISETYAVTGCSADSYPPPSPRYTAVRYFGTRLMLHQEGPCLAMSAPSATRNQSTVSKSMPNNCDSQDSIRKTVDVDDPGSSCRQC
jgi:hypothetical protein